MTWEARAAAAVLRELGAQTAEEAAAQLSQTLDEPGCRAFAERFAAVRPATVAGPAVDNLVPSAHRRRIGAYFTPAALADLVAAQALDPEASGLVADLSCGAGELLRAALRRAPGVHVVGVERELVFAAAAAARLRDRAASVLWGDGLDLRPELVGAAAIVGNPPYVGEKGNRALFESARAAHPDLARWFGPRLDLHYLFLHRALDLLRAGGTLAYLTSEYWLTATGAARLRADLSARSQRHRFRQLGAGAFDSAPGHHSLIFVAERRAAPMSGDGGATWHPFARVERAEAGVALGELCADRQGFVSGADRVTRRMAIEHGWQPDEPIYIWRAAEVPAARHLFRPLLRRSDCVANEVFRVAPARDLVLWSDGEEDEQSAIQIERLLAKFKPMLEQRREVRAGTMPWRRIWWPRRTAEYARPKLVVPRRANAPSMCLDLSGSHVSSDCTFLLAPPDVDAVPWLLRVMLAANSPEAVAQLRAYGKTKGNIIEFYATPLRQWRLPLVRDGGRLRLLDDALERRAGELERELTD